MEVVLLVLLVVGLAGFVGLARSYLHAPAPEDPAPALPNSARATHIYVIGQSGTGKSKFLEGAALNDILSGQGVCVIDPHGDLFKNLVLHLASHSQAQPDLAERLVILDPANERNPYTVCFNPLESFAGVSPHRLAAFLSDVIVKLWNVDPTSSPRMMDLLLNSFLALSELHLTLLDLPRFLRDRAYRTHLLTQVHSAEVRDYFTQQFPESPGAVQQWITPVLNKIGRLVFDPEVKLLFAASSTINFRELMDQKKVLLVNLSKGDLGEGASSLLGAFVVASIQKAALSRSQGGNREPFYLYLDEFQNYTTDNIKEILTESRKFALSLTLAHQYLEQLPEDIKHAVLNTAGTVIAFRIGYHNATHLVHELFPAADFLVVSESFIRFARLGGLPVPLPGKEEEPLGWERLTALLAHLPNREFVVRRRPAAPSMHRTFDLPDPVKTPELLSASDDLLLESGRRYGRLKAELRNTLTHAQPIPTVPVSPHDELIFSDFEDA